MLTDLDFADAAFCGNGPDPSAPPLIGVERKRLADALACMDDGRYAGTQLRGLVRTYDVVWFVVEDTFRAHPVTGVLEKLIYKHANKYPSARANPSRWVPATFNHRRPVMHRDFTHWLMSVTHGAALETGKHVHWTSVPHTPPEAKGGREFASWLWSTYTWWQKRWQDHKSLNVFDKSKSRPTGRGLGLVDPPQVAHFAKEFDGVGWKHALAISDRFESVRALTNASVSELLEVEGVGKVLAASIVEQANRKRKLPSARRK